MVAPTDPISGIWEEERRFGPAPGPADTTGDGAHVLWFEDLPDGRVRFVWDGVPGEPFDHIQPQLDGAPVAWSDDARRLAYWGERSGRFFVGIDGSEAGPYDSLTRSVPPTFSRAGRHLAYGAYIDGVPRLVVDGQVQESWHVAPARPVFDLDGERLAFVAESRSLTSLKKAADYRQWLVVDGVEHERVDGISSTPGGILFGAGGGLAYGSIANDEFRYVVNGVPGPIHKDAQAPTFSPDGQRFAYVARGDDGMVLYVDGQPGPRYRLVGAPIFSPDSRRLAYVGFRQGRRATAVIDGREDRETTDLWGNIAFSPDSVHSAYLAIEEGSGLLGRFRTRGRAVADGVPSGVVWDEFTSELHFSPDSQHMAFAAQRQKVRHMVLDGLASPPFDQVGPPRFGATGSLAYMTQTGQQFAIVVNGVAGPPIDEPTEVAPGESFLISPDGAHVASVGRVAGGWRPIVDDRVGPAFTGVGRILFDGDRVSFAATRPDGVYRVATRLGA